MPSGREYPPRPRRGEYYMKIAFDVARRATCDRAHVGCVLVKDDRIIATGYNGSPPGYPHCDDEGHDMEGGKCVRTVHAELNTLLQCAMHGISAKGATAYCTVQSCYRCTQYLVSAGVKHLIYFEKYNSMSEDDLERIQAFVKGGFRIYTLNDEGLWTPGNLYA